MIYTGEHIPDFLAFLVLVGSHCDLLVIVVVLYSKVRNVEVLLCPLNANAPLKYELAQFWMVSEMRFAVFFLDFL